MPRRARADEPRYRSGRPRPRLAHRLRRVHFLAPSDEAFTSLSADGITDLLADPELLVETLENHLIEGRLDAAALSELDQVTTAFGTDVAVTATDGVMIGDAMVTTADVSVGDRGIIHVVDALLVPGD